jgi:pimeloyl-ACP methyl ester carboxylesterase
MSSQMVDTQSKRCSFLRWIRLVLMIIAGLFLFGLLGVAAALAASVVMHRRGARRGGSRWTTGGFLLAASLFCGLLAIPLGHAVHFAAATPDPPALAAASSPYSQPDNMADLFNEVARTYATSDPVHIAPVGTPTNNAILVMLPGQVANHLWSAVKVGLGVPNDPGAAMVRGVIEEYRREKDLAPGTTVILAGHSFGGMLAQLIANDPGAPDFRVAAVVTFGSPSISGHVPGIRYQQYFSQYDFVPLFSSYELAPPVVVAGLIGTLNDLLAMQASSGLKALFTGQTYVPDMGQYWHPRDWIHLNGTWDDAHDGYGQSSWLARQTLTYRQRGVSCVLPAPSGPPTRPARRTSSPQARICYG